MKINGLSQSTEKLKTLDAYRASQRLVEMILPVDPQLRTGSPYLVASIDHTYGVAVPVSREWAEQFDKQPDRNSLKLVTTSTFRRDTVDYLQVTLTDENLLRTFGDFVDNLLDVLADAEPIEPGELTLQLLTDSQRLFRAAGTVVPSNEIQVGLLLELETLRSLYETFGPDILRRWTGPDNERHDFEIEDGSLECKATLRRENLAVTIHGAHQLDPMGGKPLTLLVRKYERTFDGGTSIPDMIREISDLPGISPEELVRKLAESGLSPEVLEKDNDFTRFFEVETHEFDVTSDFPSIKSALLPERISHVSYTVDLRAPASIPGHHTELQILRINQ